MKENVLGYKLSTSTAEYLTVTRVKDTHKEFEMTGTDQAITSVVTWSTNHQQRRSGLHQGGNWIRLQEEKKINIYTPLS